MVPVPAPKWALVKATASVEKWQYYAMPLKIHKKSKPHKHQQISEDRADSYINVS